MFIVAVVLAAFVSAEMVSSERLEPQPSPTDALLGTWDVDLRPTPDAEPYVMTMTIERNEQGKLAGTFYNGVEMSNVVANTSWAHPWIAFTTEDQSGVYHTSFRLNDEGTLEGTTHAVGRDFLAVWTAKPAE